MDKISDDFEIINAVKSGKTELFSEIIDRYQHMVAVTIYGLLGDCQEAEDIGQEVFVRFYKSISNFRGEAKLSTYLTRIAINLSLNEIKRRNRREIFSIDYWIDNNKLETDNAGLIKTYEKTEFVQYALNKLEPKFRSVIVLRLINGYNTEETAEILSLPKGTVLSRLARAQKKLKTVLTPLLED